MEAPLRREPAVIGRNIQINQESYQLVGVIRPILEYQGPADLWTPVSFQPSDLAESKRGSKSIEVIGRLKPGVSLEQSPRRIPDHRRAHGATASQRLQEHLRLSRWMWIRWPGKPVAG